MELFCTDCGAEFLTRKRLDHHLVNFDCCWLYGRPNLAIFLDPMAVAYRDVTGPR